MSKQRDLVLDIIKQSHTHPTAEEIFFEARKKMPSIALEEITSSAIASRVSSSPFFPSPFIFSMKDASMRKVEERIGSSFAASHVKFGHD